MEAGDLKQRRLVERTGWAGLGATSSLLLFGWRHPACLPACLLCLLACLLQSWILYLPLLDCFSQRALASSRLSLSEHLVSIMRTKTWNTIYTAYTFSFLFPYDTSLRLSSCSFGLPR